MLNEYGTRSGRSSVQPSSEQYRAQAHGRGRHFVSNCTNLVSSDMSGQVSHDAAMGVKFVMWGLGEKQTSSRVQSENSLPAGLL